MEEDRELTLQESQAAMAAVYCKTLTEAAEMVDVSLSTLMRWRKQAWFQREMDRHRKEQVQRVHDIMAMRCEDAVNTLGRVMRTANQSPMAQVAAAKTMLQSVKSGAPHDDLRERMQAMEQQLGLVVQALQTIFAPQTCETLTVQMTAVTQPAVEAALEGPGDMVVKSRQLQVESPV